MEKYKDYFKYLFERLKRPGSSHVLVTCQYFTFYI